METRRRRLEEMSPSAAAALLLKEGMTLTQMYTNYVQCKDELSQVKAENEQLNQSLAQILTELEEKVSNHSQLCDFHI